MGLFYAIGYGVGVAKREYQRGRENAIHAVEIRAAKKAEDDFIARVTELALTDKLAAIKLHRLHTNSSLAEAIDFVKRVRGETPIL